jgi:DNA-binding NtrC family response regulator
MTVKGGAPPRPRPKVAPSAAATPPQVASSGQLMTTPSMLESVAIPRISIEVEREAGVPSGRVVEFEGDRCRLGSHPANDLVLNDPQVSRFHCELSPGRGGWRVVDSGSLNGTTAGGLRVRDADLPRPECRLELGASVLRVRELGPTAEASVPVWPSFGALFGTSLVMRRLFGVLDRVARSDVNVLVEGESGTGKELVATEIVRRGPRADRPFVIVDCGAIAPTLIESELFGHVKGSFTGATGDRIGAFEAAEGGTLFLDEIGELPLEMQPKLLRSIEAREVRRVGENRSRKIDVRIIAATNRRLEREINHGRFREDLYFRLSVVTVRVPPLRERLDDLTMLLHVFLDQLGATESARLFTPEVAADMARYDWPGNVRELRNYVERSVVLDAASPAARARDSMLPPASSPPASVAATSAGRPDLEVPFRLAKEQLVDDFERAYLEALVAWAQGNISRAARKAGLDRMYLYRLMQKHGLRPGSIKD